ncbi:MAG: hypothetical protein HQ515_20680 [Phycisphaeraceae bacterium]|nr:hypothetical protein [Phycisphaeraceae bacterium]
MNMKVLCLSLLLIVTFFGGCGNRTYRTTLELQEDNRAALHMDKGSPRITMTNQGPAEVLVKFNQSGATSSTIEIQSNEQITRDIDTPGEVVIETGPEDVATVTCVIERCNGLAIDGAQPK